MTATTALAYLQLQPNLRTREQMTFHLIGECGRFGLWPFWTYTVENTSAEMSPVARQVNVGKLRGRKLDNK